MILRLDLPKFLGYYLFSNELSFCKEKIHTFYLWNLRISLNFDKQLFCERRSVQFKKNGHCHRASLSLFCEPVDIVTIRDLLFNSYNGKSKSSFYVSLDWLTWRKIIFFNKVWINVNQIWRLLSLLPTEQKLLPWMFLERKNQKLYIHYFLLNQIHFFSTESHIYYTTMTFTFKESFYSCIINFIGCIDICREKNRTSALPEDIICIYIYHRFYHVW